MEINIENKLESIEARLSAVEKRLGLLPKRSVKASFDIPEITSTKEVSTSASGELDKPGSWLGIVAVVCFILAAGFIVKLSIDSGWLTPVRQMGLSLLLALSLIGAGFWLIKSDSNYASLLPGAGIIIFYLTTYAAHRYYSLISFENAIIVTGLVSSLCIACYLQIKNDIYIITAALGAYISPVILGFSTNADFSLYYFLLCSLTFGSISIWLKSRMLTLISSYLAILMSSIIGFGLFQDILVASTLVLHFVIFSAGTYFYTIHNKLPLNEQEASSFLPILLIFYAAEYYFIDRIKPGLAPWISIGFTGVLLGLYFSAKKYFPDSLASKSLVLAFTTIVCFHSIYIELLSDILRSWLFVIIVLIATFSSFKGDKFSVESDFRLIQVPFLAILAILAIEYITMLFHLFAKKESSWLLVSFASLFSIWIAIIKLNNAKKEGYGQVLLFAAHLLAVTGLYRLTLDISSLAVSASWLFYAVGVMLFAFNRKDESMAKSALFVLAFSAGKALLYDAASAPTILRIFCLLLTGAVLYGCGFLMRRINGWDAKI